MKKVIFMALVILTGCWGQNLYAQYILSGHVRDKEDGAALAFASVYVPKLGMGAQTNEKGSYELSGLPKGKLKVEFSYLGYKKIIKEIYVKDAGNQLDVQLEPTALHSQEVVISGGTYSTQHDNAIKIELIKSDEILMSGASSLTEALTEVPGVDVISKGPGVGKPIIRGLSMTNILMLNNGVKLENFQFSENHPFLVDEFASGGVEVIKGPASLLYGSDAVGGVINVLHEKPAPKGKIIGDFVQQFHTNTSGLVSSVGIKGNTGTFSWGVRGSLKSHEDYTDGDGERVPNTRFDEQSLKLNAALNRKFGIFRLFYDYNRPKLGMCVPASVKLVTENGRDNEVWYQDLTNHLISSRNTLFLGDFKVDVNAALQMNNRKLQTDNATPAFEMVDMDLTTFSYELKTYLPSGLNSDYIIGFQGAVKTNRNNEAPNHVLPDADVYDYSVFALLQHSFAEKLKTQAGLRYDFRAMKTKEVLKNMNVDTDFGNISASLGATYQIGSDILLRANLASAYRTPNLAELTQDGQHGARYEQGNPDLKPQRSYEADLSMHLHSNWFLMDVAVFYNHINDYIFLSPTNDTTAAGLEIYRYLQSNAHLYGGELIMEAQPLKWFNVKGTYSYLVGEQDNDQNLPFIPQNKFKLELKLEKEKLAFMERAYFRLGGTYAAKQDRPAMFETESPDYFLMDLGLGAQIKWGQQKLMFSVIASNLLDEFYIDHLSTLKGLGYGNMGRSVIFNLKIPFALKN
jgi:iron complex outermembrane receptor protein